jgi:septal ring factor EnvC (AmiA/AmiB activator)
LTRLKTTLYCFCLLLCLCLAAMPTTAYAATYQITDEQLTKLETIFNQLQIINSQLQSDLTLSKQDLMKLDKQLAQLQEELKLAKSDLAQSQLALTKANTYLATYEKQVNKEIASLKFQRNAAIIGGLLFLIF